jgi:hypothetical protein
MRPWIMTSPVRPIQMHTKTKGDVSELFVTARLLELGKKVLKPVGDNSRYDLVVEEADGRFVRVQVKTAYIDSATANCLRFPTCSSANHTTNAKKMHYRGQVDVFAVYYPVTRTVYWIPIDSVGTSIASLRLAPALNGQNAGVRYAKDYEL